MIKTLQKIMKQDKEKFVVPKGVQQAIPIRAIWPEGIFQVGNKFSRTFRFEDINYAVASKEDKEAMFLSYSELLNSFDSGATTKITINNRRLNKTDFESSILIPLREDGLDEYRREYNRMLLEKATGANSIVQDKYVTVSVAKKEHRGSAELLFPHRHGPDHPFFPPGLQMRGTGRHRPPENPTRLFSAPARKRFFASTFPKPCARGTISRTTSCPDTLEFERDYFRMGNRFGRVIFLREYASFHQGQHWWPSCAT